MQTKTETNWQEVAEETARNLGWYLKKATKYECNECRTNITGEEVYWAKDTAGGSEGITSEYWPIERIVFRWETVGQMVEKAEEMGWQILINQLGIYFHLMRTPKPLTTHTYSIKEHGHVKAACLAFNEIFKMKGE